MGLVFRIDLQKLARLRLREARLLLDNGMFDGAFHIAGFSVECALKACFAKSMKKHQYPDKNQIHAVHTHKLNDLVKAVGLSASLQMAKTNALFETRWRIVSDWTPEARYELTVTEQDARDFYNAIAARNQGVLQWIRGHW